MRAQATRIGMAIVALAVICVGSAYAGDTMRMRARLRAAPSAGDISGAAKYIERGPQHKRFAVEIEGFVPGTEMAITINDVYVGSVKIDDLGVGELKYETRADAGEDWLPFPDDFPEVHQGDVVKAGQLGGTLVGVPR